MTIQGLGIRALLLVSVLSAGSWGWGLGGGEGRGPGGARPLGVVGAAGDTQVGLLTIHGHHLLPVEGELQVKLGGQLLEVVSATPEEIQALLPAGLPPGTYLLQVLAGPDASWAAAVTVGMASESPVSLTVTNISLREAHADPVAQTLLLRGEGFVSELCPTPMVTLADVPLGVLNASAAEIRARLPAGLEAGSYRVRVLVAEPPPVGYLGSGTSGFLATDSLDVTVVSAGAGGGDITAVNTPAGGGLQGGVTSGDANLGLLTCGAGQILKSDGATWSCAADADADSGVNEVLGSGGITGSITGRTLTLGSTATTTNKLAGRPTCAEKPGCRQPSSFCTSSGEMAWRSGRVADRSP